jgi:hypothetical protein
MLPLAHDVWVAFQTLAPCAEVGAPVCRAAASNAYDSVTELRRVCTLAGLSHAKAAEVESLLIVGESVGLFERMSPLNWLTRDHNLAVELAPLLTGVQLYKSYIHKDDNVVDVVLSKPPEPSLVAVQLENMLRGTWGLLDTRELLPSIAELAQNTFSVMSPFMDEMGAAIVVNLFERTMASEKYLVLRLDADGKPPAGLASVRQKLDTLGVQVLNFRIDKIDSPGNETFHAKVVLADAIAAYVGSSNMHKWSFEYSLELGLYVRGKAASRISDILTAVRAVSDRMPVG